MKLFRLFPIVILVSLFLCGCSSRYPILTPDGIYVNKRIQAVQEASVVVVSSGQGSGVVIYHNKDKSWILTAAHVVANPAFILGSNTVFRSIIVDGTYRTSVGFPANVIYINAKKDLAVLEVKDHGMFNQVIKISESLPPVGSTIYHSASPYNCTSTVFKGSICRYDKTDGIVKVITKAGVGFGSSGGAVVNEDLELIGIMQSMEPFLHTTHSISSIEILKELRSSAVCRQYFKR